jgi:hypothetical protein
VDALLHQSNLSEPIMPSLTIPSFAGLTIEPTEDSIELTQTRGYTSNMIIIPRALLDEVIAQILAVHAEPFPEESDNEPTDN